MDGFWVLGFLGTSFLYRQISMNVLWWLAFARIMTYDLSCCSSTPNCLDSVIGVSVSIVWMVRASNLSVVPHPPGQTWEKTTIFYSE